MDQIKAKLLLSDKVDDYSGTDLITLSEEDVAEALIPYFENQVPLFLIYSVHYGNDTLGEANIISDKIPETPEDIMTIINFINFVINTPEDRLINIVWFFNLDDTLYKGFELATWSHSSSWDGTIQTLIGEDTLDSLSSAVFEPRQKTIILDEYDYVNFALGYFDIDHQKHDYIGNISEEAAHEIFKNISNDDYNESFVITIEYMAVEKALAYKLENYNLELFSPEIRDKLEGITNLTDLDDTIDYLRKIMRDIQDGYKDEDDYSFEIVSLEEDLCIIYDTIEDNIYGRYSYLINLLENMEISIPEVFAENNPSCTIEKFMGIYFLDRYLLENLFNAYKNGRFIIPKTENSIYDGLINCEVLNTGGAYDHVIIDMSLVADLTIIILEELE